MVASTLIVILVLVVNVLMVSKSVFEVEIVVPTKSYTTHDYQISLNNHLNFRFDSSSKSNVRFAIIFLGN